jgi:hypothetical protein
MMLLAFRKVASFDIELGIRDKIVATADVERAKNPQRVAIAEGWFWLGVGVASTAGAILCIGLAAASLSAFQKVRSDSQPGGRAQTCS